MSKFIAAMDHSGGSSPGVLEKYGYKKVDKLPHEVVMDNIHLMRLRMVNSKNFTSDNIWAAILYKDTVERGMVPILKAKGIEAYLKIDSGCEDNGYLKYFRWNEMTDFAKEHGCTGTKMRSILKDAKDMDIILDQQFALAEGIYGEGLMPIVEPEVPIEHPDKANVENMLRDQLAERLDAFNGKCILKLTLPEREDFYSGIMLHDKVHKVVGLSGGYSTVEACRRLSLQKGMTASFSRGLSEGLNINQTDQEFEEHITKNIFMIKGAGSAAPN